MRYAAFLRAVNVGVHNRIKMADLRSALQVRGVEEVSTLLQSGNLVFRSELSAAEVAETIETCLGELGCKNAPAMVRTAEHVARLVQAAPFVKTRCETKAQVTFFREPVKVALPEPPLGLTVVDVTRTEAFWFMAPDAPRSLNPNAWLEKKLGVQATTRYWTVVEKTAALLN